MAVGPFPERHTVRLACARREGQYEDVCHLRFLVMCGMRRRISSRELEKVMDIMPGKRLGISDSVTREGEARASCFRMGRKKRYIFSVRRGGTQGYEADESRRHQWEVVDSTTGSKYRRGVGKDTPVMGLVLIAVGPTTHHDARPPTLAEPAVSRRSYERTEHDQLRTRSRWRSSPCRTGARCPCTDSLKVWDDCLNGGAKIDEGRRNGEHRSEELQNRGFGGQRSSAERPPPRARVIRIEVISAMSLRSCCDRPH